MSNKPTEREPLLSDEVIRAAVNADSYGIHSTYAACMRHGMNEALKLIEAKITSGELRVVKKASLIKPPRPDISQVKCSNCGEQYGWPYPSTPMNGQFCRCGSQIVKP